MLENYLQQAVDAFKGNSSSPEKRGADLIRSYTDELEGDILSLQNKGVGEGYIESYKSRYISLLLVA